MGGAIDSCVHGLPTQLLKELEGSKKKRKGKRKEVEFFALIFRCF
jgi:hypothetical protein